MKPIISMARFLPMILSVSLTSCASIDYPGGDAPSSGESVVVGRVRVISDGVEIKQLYGKGNFLEFNVQILPESSSKAISYQLKGDGTFFWRLKPGRYTIASFEWQSPITVNSGRIFAEIDVPVGIKSVYVGTLVIRFAGSQYEISVVDEFDSSETNLEPRLAKVGTPSKALMRPERRR